MKRIPQGKALFQVALTVVSLWFWCGCASGELRNEPADYVFWNGTIHTLESKQATVESIVVRGERIVFAGAKDEAMTYAGETTRVVDLRGRTLLPGFTDAHVHPLNGALSLSHCDLSGVEEAAIVLERLADFARAHPEKEWVRGENLLLPAFDEGNPHKRLLDEIIPDRPVYVVSTDRHSAWVNSRALEMANVTAETPDPANGRVERDPQTKEPTGTLREGAKNLVERFLPGYSHRERVEAARQAVRMANALGLTTLVEAKATDEDIQAYVTLAAEGGLTVHLNISILADLSTGTNCVAPAIALNHKYNRSVTNPDITFGQVKLFMDGVVEGKTAAMLDDYAGEEHNGIATTTPETAKAVIAALDRAGLQIHVHAIGDRGVRMTLDAFEHARKVNGIRDSRHHMAHLGVIHPDDVSRFGNLDLIANFQALWATLEDSYMTELNMPFLGPTRSQWQYPIGSVVRAGGRVSFGSDWPVSTMNPFHAAQVAVTRRGPDNIPREPWTPQHLIDIRTVIEGYTKGGAWQTFRENQTGTLKPGKLADLVVIDRNVLEISKFEIFETQVEMTMFRGRIVFERALARK